MILRYQYRSPKGTWTTGNVDWDKVWINAHNEARWHSGKEWHVNVAGHTGGAPAHLWDAKALIRTKLSVLERGSVVDLVSIRDGWRLRFRQEVINPPIEQVVTNDLNAWLGTPYGVGGAQPGVLLDCSGVNICIGEAIGHTGLPHSAELQRQMTSIFVPIPFSEVRPLDIGFGHWEPDPNRGGIPGATHTWAVKERRGSQLYSVWDAEGRDTDAPAGWPHEPDLGVGFRVRPGFDPYYCGEFVHSWARMKGLNA